nr:DNA polymerase III subunit gamma and tau [Ornithinimicrobium sediminis]
MYRRYRPESFADVIGQEHVTEPLMQALRTGRVNHAYLFSGPRGCGKTTSARILARCLNCAQGPTPEPCGECESCVALARGGAGSVDVIEIDAASHGGVDDARELRERAAFGPAQARYKVYIIDEAHMVTSHGFNALLKVVEEPPPHVKFIFATTEPEKVLSTIRSRTHHYPFHLVPPQRLTTYLEQVCATEGVQLEPGVLSFVTRAGGGSVRDSLSVLDQLISGAGDEGLTYERTAALLGFTDLELLDAVVDAVAAQDAAGVFRQVDKVMESGHDPRRFVEDLLDRYRDLIVVSAVGERIGGLLPGVPEDQVERMRHQATAYGTASLTRCADIVSRGLAEMTGAVSYRLLLELVCARLLLPAAAGEQGYAARLDRIERRLAAGGPGGSSPTAGAPASRAEPRAGGGRDRPEQEHPQQGRPVQAHPHQGRPEPARPEQMRPEPERPQEQPAAEPPRPVSQSEQVSPEVVQPPAEPVATPEAAPGPGHLDTDAVRRHWPEVLDAVKGIRRVTWSFVSVNTQVVDYDGERLLLEIATPGQAETFRRGNHAEVVRQALIEAIGLDTRVDSRVSPGAEAAPDARRGGRGTGPPVSGDARTAPGQGQQAPRGGRTQPSQGGRPSQPARGAEAPAGGQAQQGGSRGTTGRGVPHDGPPPMEEPPPADPPEEDWERRASGDAPAWAVSGAEPVAVSAAGPAAPRPAAAPDTPEADDEDLQTSSAVGQPVIESVLGGTVIAVDDDSAR